MATKKQPIVKASSLDELERFKLGDIGALGVNINAGVSNEELKRELTYPNAVKTYKEMAYHPAISSAMTLYEVLLSQAKFKIVAPENATEKEKQDAEFIRQVFNDMDMSFSDFIRDALSAQQYGFSVHEKVFRRRFTGNGSKYNDGRIGIKKLSIRSQDTIEKFIFDDSGNEVLGVSQDLSLIGNAYGRFSSRKSLKVNIPRSKYIHIRVGKHRGDPYGKSPLNNVYFAWKFLTTIEDLEAQSVQKDLTGVGLLKIPAAYLATDASAEKKKIAEYFKNMLRNLQQGTQAGILLPSDASEETRLPLFDFELLSADGKKLTDTSAIKKYYQDQILIALMADVLLLGTGNTGSFALGNLKNNLVGAMCTYLIGNILQEVNNDLIRQLYTLNGMDVTRMCKMDSDNVEDISIEELSKAFQRASSTGLIELDRSALNRVRCMLGLDELPEDLPPQLEILTGNTSRSGDGMGSPSGNGTSTDGNNIGLGGDNNLENTA